MATELSDARWQDFWHFYQGLPNQAKAVRMLAARIRALDPLLLTEEADWAEAYHSSPVAEAVPQNPLDVAWENQNDNADGQGYRECFSSSCAMLARYRGKVAGDNAYNVIRARYGDSTSAEAQLAALRSLGLKAEFRTDGTAAILEREINAGRPVAVGWLHHGTPAAPSGGGHWTVVIGYTDDHWIMNDPNGEADLVNGGYTSNTNGKRLAYSRQNWNPRWMVGGSGGWYLTCSG